MTGATHQLRSIDPAQASKVREEIVKDAAAVSTKQLKAHFHRELTATEERLFKALNEKAAGEGYDKGKEAGIQIGRAETKAARTWTFMAVALASMGIGVLGTAAIYERQTQTNVLTGVAIGRGEAGNEELKQIEDAR